MRFLVHVPAPPLNRFVERFYAPVGATYYQCEYVMPGPLADLKVNFGGVIGARRAGTSDWYDLPVHGWCMGLWGTYHAVRWPVDLNYIGISFRAGGLRALLGIDAHEVGNRVVALDELLGAFALELRDRLAEAPDIQARFALLEDLLTAGIRFVPDTDRIAPALNMLERCNGLVPIAELAATIDVSHKHLVTLFNRVVGAPPKTLARMYRLQHLLTAIEREEPRTWTKVAHDFYYCDQAHFNNDFKRSTGHSPATYVEKRRMAEAANPSYAKHPRLLPLG